MLLASLENYTTTTQSFLVKPLSVVQDMALKDVSGDNAYELFFGATGHNVCWGSAEANGGGGGRGGKKNRSLFVSFLCFFFWERVFPSLSLSLSRS